MNEMLKNKNREDDYAKNTYDLGDATKEPLSPKALNIVSDDILWEPFQITAHDLEAEGQRWHIKKNTCHERYDLKFKELVLFDGFNAGRQAFKFDPTGQAVD